MQATHCTLSGEVSRLHALQIELLFEQCFIKAAWAGGAVSLKQSIIVTHYAAASAKIKVQVTVTSRKHIGRWC